MSRLRGTRLGGTERIARWSIRHRWWAIGLWLAFVATAVVAGGMTEVRQATGSDLGVGESGRAERIVEAAESGGACGPGQDRCGEPPTDAVLLTPQDGAGWDPAAAQAAAREIGDRLAALPEVARAGDPVPSPAADAVLLPLTLTEDADREADIVPVLDELAALAPDHPDLRVEGVGGESIGHGIDEAVNEDLGSAGLLSLPVTLAILLVVFGALFAAGVPLLLAFSAVAAATGLWAFVSHAVPDIGSVQHVILLIGLAVGVDYSLFYLRREREERRRGHDTVDAVRLAAATSGRAVVVSALTSVVALSGVYLVGDGIFSALGTGVILAVAVAMVGSLTVLPALLVTLGRAMDRPRVPLLWRLTQPRGEQPRFWPAVLAPALRAPRTTLALALAVLVALAIPAAGMSLKNSTAEDLPRSIPVVRAYDRLVAAFPGEGEAHQVAVRAPAAQEEAVRAALDGLVADLAGNPLFAVEPAPQVRTFPDGTVSTLEVGYPYAYGSPEAEESLAALRTELLPAAVGGIAGVEYAVGGDLADSLDYTDRQAQRLPWVIGFVVLLTVAMMAVAFRSLVVAALAGMLNLLSVGAAFGVLTLTFQHGLLESGYIISWLPLFLFVVLFGLSMDYHVFVVSRIREAAMTGMSTRDAVRIGITRTAGAVTSAAAVMVAVFSIFATLSLLEMRQLGVGLAAAIAIDATIVRILLLPAAMNLLGRANWWPSAPGRAARHAPAPAAAPVAVPAPVALARRD